MRKLVLIGGGHAHVQVLADWARSPVADVELTVIVDVSTATYSGMLPGFVAGLYQMRELQIDVARLAARAGARVITTAVTAMDLSQDEIHLQDGPRVGFDVASLNVGSHVRDETVRGVKEHALRTRPIGVFAKQVHLRLQAAAANAAHGHPQVVVAGAGAAGVELTLAVRAWMGASAATVTLVGRDESVLPTAPVRVQETALAALHARNIQVHLGVGIEAVEDQVVILSDGRRIQADLAVWSTGAAPPPLLASTALPLDGAGLLAVKDTLQSTAHEHVFAAGDCAGLLRHPWVPRAGVYAVREGEVLTHNLHAYLCKQPLRRYKPQRRYLTLLSLGDGRALGYRGNYTFEGRWVWWLKDAIDRRWMRRYQS